MQNEQDIVTDATTEIEAQSETPESLAVEPLISVETAELAVETALDELIDAAAEAEEEAAAELAEQSTAVEAAEESPSSEAPSTEESATELAPTTPTMAPAELQSAIESIIFSSERSVSITRLKEVFGETGPSEDEIRAALDALVLRYRTSGFGIELRSAQGGYHFVTKAENAELIRKYHASKPFRLGRSALETLAIIAYRQPITRAEIDQIRGIDSSHLMRTLIERGMVKMAGKADVPGRPVQYGTTERFLEILGLKDLGELPPLSELEQLQGSVEDPAKRVEAGLARFMADDTKPQTEFDLNDERLEEIGSLIESAGDGAREVFASPVHAEVAAENKAALEGFLATFKAKRKGKSQQAAVETPMEVQPAPVQILEQHEVGSTETVGAETIASESRSVSYEDLVPSSDLSN